MKVLPLRVGFGYDVHRLTPRRKLILGGVLIPSPIGLSGHSDADVLLHAICDALLGAAALGDIGRHFPNTSKGYKNISSLVLLRDVGKMLERNGLEIANIDSTVVLEAPKIARYIMRMRQNIATVLGVKKNLISVKATTNEGLGSLGRGVGCAAFAVAAVVKAGQK